MLAAGIKPVVSAQKGDWPQGCGGFQAKAGAARAFEGLICAGSFLPAEMDFSKKQVC